MRFLNKLTAVELDYGSQAVGFDLVTAITEPTKDRTKALAAALWLQARRSDPAVTLDSFLAKTVGELADLISDANKGEPEGEVDSSTGPTNGPSSPESGGSAQPA